MAEPLARAAFETTLDERVDVYCRYANMFASMRTRQRLGFVLLLALAGVGTFASMRWLMPTSPVWVDAAATLTAVAIVAWGAPSWLQRAHRQTMRRVMLEATGDGPKPFVVELHADRVVADSSRQALSVPWREIRTVRAAGGDVELTGEHMLIVVRSRAFATPAAAAAFRDVAESLRAAAARRVAP